MCKGKKYLYCICLERYIPYVGLYGLSADFILVKNAFEGLHLNLVYHKTVPMLIPCRLSDMPGLSEALNKVSVYKASLTSYDLFGFCFRI